MVLMSTLSVALCTYNGDRYLEAQLESIAAQTRQPDELVVGDDSSTDHSIAIIRRFAAQARFPVHLHINDSNLGSTRNFERTISRCKGEIIALSDQDDVWLNSKLAKLEAVLDRDHDVGLVFSDAELIDEDSHPLGRRLWEWTFPIVDQKNFRRGQWMAVLTAQNVVTGSTMAFRAKFRQLALPVPEVQDTIHDAWIALVVGVFARLAFINEPLIHYRQHRTQQLGIKPLEQRCIVHYSGELERLSQINAHLTKLRDKIASSKSGWDARRLDRQVALVEDRMIHYRVRSQLSPKRRERVGPVLQEFIARRYHRYSRGTASALADLLVRDANDRLGR